MARSNNLNENIQDLAPLKEDLASSLQNRVIPTTNRPPIRESSTGTGSPFYSGSSAHAPGLFGNLMDGERTGGGMGGGSEDLKVDPMDTNRFVEMNLNPYLTDNIHSFKDGGRVHDMYNYGGRTPKYADGGATHTMPDGTVHPGATHEDYMAMMGGGNQAAAMYGHGGTYSQQANEMIAMNQISNLMGNVNSPYTNNQQPPMANNGMRMNAPQPSNMAGSENQLGALAAKLQQEMPNPQDAMNMVSKLTGNQPMANQGMKMDIPKYANGGESWRYEQNKLGPGGPVTASADRYIPEVVRLEEKKRREQFYKDEGVYGTYDFQTGEDIYHTEYRVEEERRKKATRNRDIQEEWTKDGKSYREYYKDDPTKDLRSLEEFKASTDNYDNFKNPWEQDYDNWYQGSGGGSQQEGSGSRIDREVYRRYTQGGRF